MAIIAAIAHYQFATIHPYFDGNGRTARLLTNLVLHKSGYGLKGIYSLEEYYATNLQADYDALAEVFANVRLKASDVARSEKIDHHLLLRELDQRQKQAVNNMLISSCMAISEVNRSDKRYSEKFKMEAASQGAERKITNPIRL